LRSCGWIRSSLRCRKSNPRRSRRRRSSPRCRRGCPSGRRSWSPTKRRSSSLPRSSRPSAKLGSMRASPLRAAIQDKQFASAYYLYGEDDFLKDEAVRHLLDAAVDPATRDFNLDVRKGADLDGESLASLLGMPPMMADRRVVVVRDVSGLRKE